MRLGRGFTAVARQVPRLAQGAVPLDPTPRPLGAGQLVRHAAWPGFYRHSATGLMARNKGQHGFETTLAFRIPNRSNHERGGAEALIP